MRSPAPRVNAENRAEVIRNATSHSNFRAEPKDDFAAPFFAPCYRLALPFARAIITLARLGRAFT
jgi:hypothetical protein